MGGAEVGSRPRWWDAVALVVLAAVILAGLIHYGRRLGDDDEAGHRARLESAEPTDPATSTESGNPGTCWDGRATTSLALCGLPHGASGLAWVFPSFADRRDACRRAGPHGYPVVESYQCSERVQGRPVEVIYDVVADVREAARWLGQQAGARHRRVVPGSHGGSTIFEYRHHQQTRITGLYARFPYAATVIAPDAETARRAWQRFVRQRPPSAIRGVRG